MAYDEKLAGRVLTALGETPGCVEKKMFGGVGYLVNGNMACGVNKDRLIVRLGEDNYSDALAKPHVRVFDMTGRAMKGWITVEPAGLENETDLKAWVDQGVEFAKSLPPK